MEVFQNFKKLPKSRYISIDSYYTLELNKKSGPDARKRFGPGKLQNSKKQNCSPFSFLNIYLSDKQRILKILPPHDNIISI